ncbi:hypothetical protein BGZ95_008528 [Linnemannia exigua]|uniref:F-box domain-containing protein n=1 Tax=Linnemannia exigua TaxID=604196 RepID=A0AAD4H8G4_9FUNG|nr:hypothetical protein BGZ95_008528 [Linnemannia exigua]
MFTRRNALLRPQDTFSIPELLDKVGSHLHPPDLLSCIQVNKRWNTHLIPLLWETVDDSQYSWRRFLEGTNKSKDLTVSPSVEDVLGRVLSKNGHLIRHLKIHFPIMIDAVYLSGVCTNLLSLEVFDLLLATAIRTRITVGKLQRQCGFNSLATGDVNSLVTILTNEQPLLSPVFQNVFVAPSSDPKPNPQDAHDRLTVQRFWLLVQQNSQCLCKLRLDRSLNILSRIASVDFLRNMILSLRRLNNFENNSELVNVGEFLDRLPHLQTLVTPTFFLPFNDINIIKTTPLKLRTLSLSGQLLTRGFFTILGGLPGLEFLRVLGLSWDNVTDKDIDTIMGGTPSGLRTLEYLFSGVQYIPTEERIFCWLPHLRKLKALQILAETVSDLVKFCPLLEEYHEWNDGVTIEPDREFKPQLNALAPLLRGCPHLRVINGIQHRMEVSELLRCPWVATNLDIFRVQIVGVPRLSVEQQDRFERAMKKAALSETLVSEERALFRLYRQSRDEQHQILQRLGTLSRLRVLDLGYEYRQVDHSPRMVMFEGKEYIGYGGPIYDTLELSLDAGLTTLGGLKELEVFGFEGVNHCIGEKELDWMGDSWPRLRALRGLQTDVLRRAKPDRRRDALRKYMVSIRPDVQHRRA